MWSLRLPAMLCLLAALPGFAQKADKYKFAKISPEMLQQKVYSIDSGAHAVVLADVGATDIDLNRGNYAVEYSRHLRIHILDKNGYDEATIQVPLYHDRNGGNADRIDNIKAVAYNLENGKVVETKLGKDAIFTEKANRNMDLTKFTLPGVHEGTIIDVQYKIYSSFYLGMRGWTFQGRTPRLWTEYSAAIPQFTVFETVTKGFVPLMHDVEQRTVLIGQTSVSFFDNRWVATNVPAMRFEGFVSSPVNYLSRIEFHLTALQAPLQPQRFISNWANATKTLLESDDFGGRFDKNNVWLNDIMKPLTQGSALEQAQNIYAYVRDGITCSGQEGIYLNQSVKDVVRTKMGSVADVNILLTTMLRHAGLDADPVMLSTRDNGFVYSSIPILSRFNYIIVALKIEGQTYHLDASKPRLAFAHLTPDCYNGMARIINKDAQAIMLVADSLREKSLTFVQLNMDGKNGWKGSVQQVKGYNNSYESRKTIQDKGQDTYFADIRKAFPVSARVSNVKIDSLRQYEAPLGLRYDLKVEANGEDLIYFNPMLSEAIKENPFLSEERVYPVEMPYTMDQTYVLRLEVPEGYMVDELPKSVRVGLNDRNEASYQYIVSETDGFVSLRSQIRFDRAIYQPEEYEVLREFYTMIMAKQKEQIVFKKKK